jgi:hypothetical protein
LCTFLIDSFDFRDGNKERQIRDELFKAFNGVSDDYDVTTKIITKVGFNDSAVILLSFEKISEEVEKLIRFYKAELTKQIA